MALEIVPDQGHSCRIEQDQTLHFLREECRVHSGNATAKRMSNQVHFRDIKGFNNVAQGKRVDVELIHRAIR